MKGNFSNVSHFPFLNVATYISLKSGQNCEDLMKSVVQLYCALGEEDREYCASVDYG